MSKLRLAISGGGIASICLAHALVAQHPQWDVKVFEARADAELRDDGGAFGLANNAQTALALISADLRAALDEAGAVRMDPSFRLMMGIGKDYGHHIGDVRPAVSQMVVQRGAFWHSLYKLLPSDILEFGKTLDRVEERGDKVELHFTDGTSYEADALVGCDGINSMTRKAVLGPHHPKAVAPIYTKGYGHRTVVPIETARAAFGDEYCSFRTQCGWIGHHFFMLTDHVNGGKSMQVIAGGSRGEPWTYPTPFVEWPKERLVSDLSSFGPIGKAFIKVFTEQPKLYAAAGRIHPETPTYFRDRICIAGDAAQSFSPAQGAGAGQAIEDALILSTALGACATDSDIPKAFHIYDSIRRPRRAEVASKSSWAGSFITGGAPGIGLDVDRLAEQIPKWASHIYDYDLAAAQAETLKLMGIELQRTLD